MTKFMRLLQSNP
jgi:5-methyltetrahydrofolate--homocysteine methyltransferase